MDNDLTRPVPKFLARKSEHTIDEILSGSHLCKRLRVFKQKGLKCVSCGITGTFFALEKHHKQNSDRPKAGWHYNLYADLPGGGTRLMTVDHIVPISRGGSKKGMYNLQPMCAKCNGKKGSKMPREVKHIHGEVIKKRIEGRRKRKRNEWRNYLYNLLSWKSWKRRLKWMWYNRSLPSLPKRPKLLNKES